MQKLIFGNFSRLPLVTRGLRGNPQLAEARGILEQESRAVVAEMLGSPEAVPEFFGFYQVKPFAPIIRE